MEIKEINYHIKDAIRTWSDIMLKADAENWAFHLNYDEEDILNALQMFIHVASNSAIKNGHLNDENIEKLMGDFRSAINKTFGFDSVELTKKVYDRYGEHK
jgi:hypothetical protein